MMSTGARLSELGDLNDLDAIHRNLIEMRRAKDVEGAKKVLKDLSKNLSDYPYIQDLIERVYGFQLLWPSVIEKLDGFMNNYHVQLSPTRFIELDYDSDKRFLLRVLNNLDSENPNLMILMKIICLVAFSEIDARRIIAQNVNDAFPLVEDLEGRILHSQEYEKLERFVDNEVYAEGKMNRKNSSFIPAYYRNIMDAVRDVKRGLIHFINEPDEYLDISSEFAEFLLSNPEIIKFPDIRHICPGATFVGRTVYLQSPCGQKLALYLHEDELGKRSQYEITRINDDK
ncbi:hypothetical protein ACFL21_01905 [Patescibacteria group bacterium]